MEKNRIFWGYVGRFTVIHVLIYTLFAFIFLFIIQDILPEPTQVALETFQPYRPVGLIATSGQILRSIVLALVLYPFYNTIVRSSRGLLILFGALWGVALLGSVQPMPGSIEGMIYTEIPLLAHLVMLAAGALEVFLFSWVFLRLERQINILPGYEKQEVTINKNPIGYSFRFDVVHVITYAAAGILLFTLQSYDEAFAVQERFELYRPLDDPIVTAAIPLQIVRGAVLAIFFYPFYDTYVNRKRGWILLFGLTFGLIALGGPNFLTGVLTDIISRTPLTEFLIGPVEITIQMFLFSVLLFLWERRRLSNGAMETEK
jgi:hypothetical protein